MDYLWSPWRYQYITQAAKPEGQAACIFCEHIRSGDDQQHFILHRGGSCYVLLNLYPYTTGHLMIVPYAHVPDFAGVSREALLEMMQLAQAAERAIQAEYRPEGINAGFNLGKCAGAGVAGHIHMHMLPRWVGDTNFMSVVGETRVLPEDLAVTWRKLRPHFAKANQ
jgi:ATP adenylyltransferase